MRFWVLENTVHGYFRIHLADCRYCRQGQGPKPGHTGKWTGFDTYEEALAYGQATGKRFATGSCCHPEEAGLRPILYKYFDDTAGVLMANYKRTQSQKASANLGSNREHFCKDFLTRVLPPRLTTRLGGEIWDSKGNATGQQDIVILRDDAPILTFGTAEVYLVEGVLGVVETKSTLTPNVLQEAMERLQRVKNLIPSEKGVMMTSGPVLRRPLVLLFAYEGSNLATLARILEQSNDSCIDMVSVLTRGALVRSGLLLNWEGGQQWAEFEGRAGALAMFYLHLVTYGTSLMARSLHLAPYMEPLNGW